MYSYAKGTCPAAERFSKTVLSLPLHLRMTKKDVERVAESLIRVVTSRSSAGAERAAAVAPYT